MGILIVGMTKKPEQKGKSQKNSRRKPSARTNWPGAVSNIVVSAINKGQLPILGIIFLLGLILWRLPEEQLSKFVFKFLEHLANGAIAGYVLSVALLFGWYIHAKAMRARFSNEAQRIGREKSDLQSRLLKENLESSDDKR